MLELAKKHLWLASLIGSAVLLAFLFFGSLLVPLVGNLCAYNEQAEATECAHHHLGPYALLWPIEVIEAHNGFVTAIATLVMAAFTGTLWLTSARQADLTIIAIQDARIASQRELRAYVSSMPLRAALTYGDRMMIVVVETENTGRTPAFKTKVLWDISMMEYPLTTTLVYQGHSDDVGKPAPTFVTYPGAKHMGVKSFDLTPEILGQIRAKTHALYVYGRVTYVDAFNDPQWGEFCAYIDGEFLDTWLKDASASENRKPVAAPFKFTQNNNTASFT